MRLSDESTRTCAASDAVRGYAGGGVCDGAMRRLDAPGDGGVQHSEGIVGLRGEWEVDGTSKEFDEVDR